MKKLLVGISVLLVVLSLPLVARAEVKVQPDIVVKATETVNDNCILTGDRITVEGTINGDLIIVGGTITVSGPVSGDVLATGGSVTVTGPVSGNIRAIAADFTLNGTVGKNVTVAASRVSIDSAASIGWSLYAGASRLTIDGAVSGHVKAGAAVVVVNGTIAGTLDLELGKKGTVELGNTARIGKDFIYRSSEQATVSSPALIGGKTQQKESSVDYWTRHLWPQLIGAFSIGIVFVKIISLFGLFIVGLVLVTLLATPVRTVLGRLTVKPVKNLLIGLLCIFLIPLICFLLFLTFIGIPLALLLITFYIVSLYLAKVLVSIWIGSVVLRRLRGNAKKEASLLGSLIIGAIIFWLLSLIPFIGWLVGFIAAIWFLGTIILFPRGATKK